jgi:TetR/AcrR family transcriptional repressor of mexJK operon
MPRTTPPKKLPVARRRVRTRLTREQKKTERAKALLDAAWAVFCEVGYEKLTIEEVADRAGYSRQPVYTLFGDKQNLFYELQSRSTIAVMDLLFAHLQPAASLRENLTKVAQVVAEQLNSNKPTYGERLYVVAQTIALSRPDIAAKLQAQARWVIDDIARLIRRSPLGRGEALRSAPEVIAAHLAAHINGLTTVQFQTGKRYASARDLTEIFLFLALARP